MKRILLGVALIIAIISLAQLAPSVSPAFVSSADGGAQPPTSTAARTQDSANEADCQCDGIIGDYVWHDLYHDQNHIVDGIQDAGEPGLEGVVIELYDSNGNFYDNVTTDANGSYQFTDLPYDDYTVKVADSNFDPGGPLEGWYAAPPDEGGDESLDSDGDRDTYEATITLSDGDSTHNDVDFGFITTGIALQKTGPSSSNVNDDITYHFRVENTGDIVLHGGAHVYDEMIEPDGDHEIWSDVVYPGEVYEFDRTYTPDSDDCGSLTNTATAVGHPQYPDGSYVDDVTDEDSWTVQVDCQTQPASLSGQVWHDQYFDEDHKIDGIRDNSEPAIDGVTVNLYDDNDNLVATTTTDTNGGYEFTNLDPGDYRVQIADSNFEANGAMDETDDAVDWHASPQDAGNDDTVDSDGDESTYDVDVTLSAGEDKQHVDFGFFQACVNFTKTGPNSMTPGEEFNFHFRVENCGDVVLHGGVTVYDALINPDGDHAIWNDVVYAGEIKEFDEAYTPSEDECPTLVNDASAEGHPVHPDGSSLPYVTDEDSWTVSCATSQASLGDYVWLDINADGVQDASEPGVYGVTVHLLDVNGALLASTSTDQDGHYLFRSLAADDYIIEFVLPDGYTFSPRDNAGDDTLDSDVDEATGKTPVVSLAEGENDMTWDAGIVYTPTNAGVCYVASDGDDELARIDADGSDFVDVGSLGVPDVEAIAFNTDWTILYGADADQLGTIDTGSGAFTAIGPFGQGDGAEGVVDFDDVDSLGFDPITGVFYGVTRRGGSETNDALFQIDPATGAYVPDAFGSGADYVIVDSGSVLGLYDIDDIAVDPAGQMYGIANSPGGDHLVKIDKQTGEVVDVARLTNDADGNGLDDMEGLTYYGTSALYGATGDGGDEPNSMWRIDKSTGVATKLDTFPQFDDYEAIDCQGNSAPASIGNYVWEDLNANGVQDANEPGIDGVTVELFKSDGTIMTTTTANGGQYSFDNLVPGDYYVQFTLPGGYVFSPQNQGDDTLDSDADTTTGQTAPTTLIAGENDPTWDAGMYRKASLGDYVWWDLDQDGVQDADENGLSDVTVTLKDANGNTVATTTTDADGAYLFDNLTPGDYIVFFDKLSKDWSYSPQNQGGDDALDSDADVTTGDAAVSLASGEHNNTIDAGETIDSSYSITKENTTAESDVAPGDPISFTITIKNTGSTWLTVIPLRDSYDMNYISYVSADPASDDNNDDGVIDWSDLTASFGEDLAPGESFSVVVHFTANASTDSLSNHETINTATAHDVMSDPDGPNGATNATPLPEQSDEAPANILNPVGEDMQEFSAFVTGSSVRLQWQTASEANILGFNVLRSSGDGRFVRINHSLIFSHHAGADVSGAYRFEDRNAFDGRHTYILEIIRLDGSIERYKQHTVIHNAQS